MSSENQQRFESLQREFAAYAEHVMTQKQVKTKARTSCSSRSYCYRGDYSSSKKGQKT